MNYRAEIDGLRALAVLPVIFFHAGFESFSGGFVGVDVFFVISGYLITGILIGDIADGNFSVVKFYERRARRLLPALVFVMLACIPVAWMLMLPVQLRDFSQSLMAVSLFASNFLFWSESGYFDTAAEEKPLLHTWSLAVEEQYYVVFPLFLFMVWRFGKQPTFWLIVLITAASFLLSEITSRTNPHTNFYLAPTRAWELLTGSITAFVLRDGQVRPNNTLAMLGLGGILAAIFIYDVNTPFPGKYALLPVLGTALIILFADKTTLTAKWLSNRLFVGVGLISYSAYLWHQPLYAFDRITSLVESSALTRLLIAAIALVLAYFSWRFIEKPFRDRNRFSAKQIFALSGISILFFVGLGLFGHFNYTTIAYGKLNPLNAAYGEAEFEFDNRKLQDESWTQLRSRGSENNNWFDESSDLVRVLVVGNSHSKDLYNVLNHSERFLSRHQLARYYAEIRDLEPFHQLFSAPNYKLADIIVIASRYNQTDVDNLHKIVPYFLSQKKRVVLVKNIYEFEQFRTNEWTLADKLFLQNFQSTQPQDRAALAERINQEYFDSMQQGKLFYRSRFEGQVSAINAEIEALAAEQSVTLLDRMDFICEVADARCFGVSPTLKKYIYDYGHHSMAGARFFGKRVDDLEWFPNLTVSRQH